MIKQKIYPNYTDNYYYSEGDEYILLKRTKSVYGGETIYQNIIGFDNEEEAKLYFENNCGE